MANDRENGPAIVRPAHRRRWFRAVLTLVGLALVAVIGVTLLRPDLRHTVEYRLETHSGTPPTLDVAEPPADNTPVMARVPMVMVLVLDFMVI
jgi:hypothetical protein